MRHIHLITNFLSYLSIEIEQFASTLSVSLESFRIRAVCEQFIYLRGEIIAKLSKR